MFQAADDKRDAKEYHGIGDEYKRHMSKFGFTKTARTTPELWVVAIWVDENSTYRTRILECRNLGLQKQHVPHQNSGMSQFGLTKTARTTPELWNVEIWITKNSTYHTRTLECRNLDYQKQHVQHQHLRMQILENINFLDSVFEQKPIDASKCSNIVIFGLFFRNKTIYVPKFTNSA